MPTERLKSFLQERARRADDAEADYESAPERPLDELKTDVTEILGESTNGMFRNSSRAAADRLESRAERADGKADIMTRREKYLEYRENATANKIRRIEDKMADSSNGFFANQINRQRRHKVKNLKFKTKVMTHQRAGIERSRKTKPEEIRKKIDKLINDRIKAAERKAQRVVMRQEKGINRRQLAQKAEFLAKITPEQKAKIVREAILQVRKENIQDGLIDASYVVDDTLNGRKIRGLYERTVE